MNINVRAAFIHVLGDLVQSLGVVVGSLIIKFKVWFWFIELLATYVQISGKIRYGPDKVRS